MTEAQKHAAALREIEAGICDVRTMDEAADFIEAQAKRIEELEAGLSKASVTVKQYIRLGYGDEVFMHDLCRTDRTLDVLLKGSSK